MAVEIISWPNLYERYVARPHDLLFSRRMAHPTDLADLATYMYVMG